MARVTRTSMFLDRDLVERAQSALGTSTVVETVREALEQAVARDERRAAVERINELVDWEALEKLHRAEGDW